MCIIILKFTRHESVQPVHGLFILQLLVYRQYSLSIPLDPDVPVWIPDVILRTEILGFEAFDQIHGLQAILHS